MKWRDMYGHMRSISPAMKGNPAGVGGGCDCWYGIATNAATKHAEIYLYGVIGGYYANAQQFLADLQGAGDVETITSIPVFCFPCSAYSM